MERALVVVFQNEKDAYEGKKALLQLDREGSVTLYAHTVIVKRADGTYDYKESDEPGPIGTLLGTAVAGLIGALGGPAAGIVGAVSGLTAGGAYDIDNARIADDFVEDVSQALLPGRAALIAQIDEDWTTPVDARMEALGGIVFRRALSEVQEDMNDEDVDAMKADIAEFKAEQATANAERKAKLQQRIDALQAKIQAQQKKNEDRREAHAKRQAAKNEILKKNAKKAGRALRELAETPV
ncbi:MAG TPA: DUF1269 domain-containing protein [Thermoanaerobaculia bacterium]|nr:DUF1269 domain-containing protein [Thermoanaerobaculia bacterium]